MLSTSCHIGAYAWFPSVLMPLKPGCPSAWCGALSIGVRSHKQIPVPASPSSEEHLQQQQSNSALYRCTARREALYLICSLEHRIHNKWNCNRAGAVLSRGAYWMSIVMLLARESDSVRAPWLSLAESTHTYKLIHIAIMNNAARHLSLKRQQRAAYV